MTQSATSAKGSGDDAGEHGHPLLDVRELTVTFGGITALNRLSFAIAEGEICGLIGPNGAGKTTTFNVISRLYEPTSGKVAFDGRDLLALPPHRIAALGIARTFQNLALFPSMSLLENVMVGAHSTGRVGFARAALRIAPWTEERAIRTDGLELLDRLGLAHLANHPAAALPFGTLKRLEIARALAAHPRFLLMDEPAAGLTHGEVDELGDMIRRIRDDFGLTVLLVEHHMALVMGISDHVVAMDFGAKIADGTAEAVRTDQRVVDAYLGGSL